MELQEKVDTRRSVYVHSVIFTTLNGCEQGKSERGEEEWMKRETGRFTQSRYVRRVRRLVCGAGSFKMKRRRIDGWRGRSEKGKERVWVEQEREKKNLREGKILDLDSLVTGE